MNKTEKQPKQKKTAGEKRLIAHQIMIGCFAAMVISSAPTMIVRAGYDKDIRVLDDKQNAIYQQFMACEEFSDSFKQEFTKVSNDYANGVISYEDFDKKVQHLNSIKYAKEVLESSNNTEFKEKVEDIKQQKQERAEEFTSNVIKNISTSAVLTSATGMMGSLLAAMIYTGKEFKEDKRKKKQTKNSGIKYYDANSGTIRDTADPSYEEKVLNVPRHVDACIIKTEEEEKGNTL